MLLCDCLACAGGRYIDCVYGELEQQKIADELEQAAAELMVDLAQGVDQAAAEPHSDVAPPLPYPNKWTIW